VQIADAVTEEERMVLFDVQTSGGLLLAVPQEACDSLVEDLRGGGDVHTAVIGEILSVGTPIVVS
jgi:selenide,water dikinase